VLLTRDRRRRGPRLHCTCHSWGAISPVRQASLKCFEAPLRKSLLCKVNINGALSWRLDLADSARPQEVPIVVANKKEFYAALKEVSA
jgi:hypothetical protein